jgi:pyruvate,water dikinase
MIYTELGRKSLSDMRWEELWDAAFRLRSAFLAAPVPDEIRESVRDALNTLGTENVLAVRSSAPGEDTKDCSFAGIHESLLGIRGEAALLDAIRTVWASLWSDAALLYRRELGLDPMQSRMAVTVQQIVEREISGVAFGHDPRAPQRDRIIIEAVPGRCANLVDGTLEPDHWAVEGSTGIVLKWTPGDRGKPGPPTQSLLNENELHCLIDTLRRIEELFGMKADIEWTGRGNALVILQARPITTLPDRAQDDRSWYLSLRPNDRGLDALHERVVNKLIPELQSTGAKLAAEKIDHYDDSHLAAAIEQRKRILKQWKKIYWDEFIPFAHGVRRLGIYYNDALRPEDPYEFIGLLRGQPLLSLQRNRALHELAVALRSNRSLNRKLAATLQNMSFQGADQFWNELRRSASRPQDESFVQAFRKTINLHMDVTFAGERLKDRPDIFLAAIVEMAQADPADSQKTKTDSGDETQKMLEKRLLQAVGEARHEEARKVIVTARLSWRLRDDDNLLLGRLESQLLRAVQLGAERLFTMHRLERPDGIGIEHADVIARALEDPAGGIVTLSRPRTPHSKIRKQSEDEKPRQLIGQPCAPGLATGKARLIVDGEDLRAFRANEVLVCDAIQPNMTHLVPLASAIVERRGGMLIHGAIIARELGIPCVNGIPDVTETLHSGDLLTVDGDLGIVTLGKAEFDVEVMSQEFIVP